MRWKREFRFYCVCVLLVVCTGGFDRVYSQNNAEENSRQHLNQNVTSHQSLWADFGSVLKEPPPVWVLWASVIGAFFGFLTFLLRIVSFWHDIRHKRKQGIRSVNDDYWLRKIILPLCIEPLILFVMKELENLHIIDTNPDNVPDRYREKLKQFKKNKEDIVSRFLFLNAYDKTIYGYVSDNIDEIEDIVVKHYAYKSLGEISNFGKEYSDPGYVSGECYSVLSKIFEYMREKHNSYFK